MPVRTYIPPDDVGARQWCDTFAAAITADEAAYGLTSTQSAMLAPLITEFDTSMDLCLDPDTRTATNIARKDDAKAAAIPACRALANIAQAYPSITNEALTAAGLTVRSTSRTPIPTPITVPLLSFSAATPGNLQMTYADSATPLSKAKPYGAIQAEVFVAIGTAPAVDPTAASYHFTATKSPFAVATAPADKGKVVTMWARWQTRTGKNGPWSQPVSVNAV